ncbi:uncharacterized protein LOC122643409 [Telopea speciosissima]|uniref:uncharacterized protein LOC122643409 n=1 Tax=Telopea speciosissima TaxID=54955 RepID=UPI001CC71567|nr:uncharacterized protein LOC122643409 [Telopea speciosissima]
MTRGAFFSLSHLMRERGLLYDSKALLVEEQLVIFLKTIGHNVKNRINAHDFGHSGETISRYFNIVLAAILQLYPILMKPSSTTTHDRISSNRRRFYPWFKDCIGVMDGSHIPAWVSFTYLLACWEGSASDSRILDIALHKEGEAKLVVPRGKYYLVDAGFANKKGFLRSYYNIRYYLKEWRNSNMRPVDKKELFNLRHSSLRNIIERVFSLLKSRFKILKNQAEYPYKTVEDDEEFFAQESEDEDSSSVDETDDEDSSSIDQTDDEDVDVHTVVEDANVDNVDWEQFREDMADNMFGVWNE